MRKMVPALLDKACWRAVGQHLSSWAGSREIVPGHTHPAVSRRSVHVSAAAPSAQLGPQVLGQIAPWDEHPQQPPPQPLPQQQAHPPINGNGIASQQLGVQHPHDSSSNGAHKQASGSGLDGSYGANSKWQPPQVPPSQTSRLLEESKTKLVAQAQEGMVTNRTSKDVRLSPQRTILQGRVQLTSQLSQQMQQQQQPRQQQQPTTTVNSSSFSLQHHQEAVHVPRPAPHPPRHVAPHPAEAALAPVPAAPAAPAPPALDGSDAAPGMPLFDDIYWFRCGLPGEDDVSGPLFCLAHPTERLTHIPEDILVINDRESARRVVDQMLQLARTGMTVTDKNGRQLQEQAVYFACDTEVAGIDVKTQSPVGHGTVICFSIYAGPWVDFGTGQVRGTDWQGQPVRSRLWVDLAAGWYEKQKRQMEEAAAAAAAAAAENALALQLYSSSGSGSNSSAAKPSRKQRSKSSKSSEPQQDALQPTDAGEGCVFKTYSKDNRRKVVMTSAAGEAAVADQDAQQLAAGTAAAAPAAAPASDPASDPVAPAAATAPRRRRGRKPLLQDTQDEAAGSEHPRAAGSEHPRAAGSEHPAAAGSEQPAAAGSEQPAAAGSEQPAAAGRRLRRQPKATAKSKAAATDPDHPTTTDSSTSDATVAAFAAAAIIEEAAGAAAATTVTPRASVSAAAATYGSGLPAPTVDDIRSDPTAAGIMEEFQRFFGDESAMKIWHNYGFDRHVLEGLGFELGGFGGDTLHMARLCDASRKISGGYSLESLSSDRNLVGLLSQELGDAAALPKRGMKERFGLLRQKTDGEPVKVASVPPVQVLHTDERFRAEWVDYSALDAKATWNVHRALSTELAKKEAVMDDYLLTQLAPHNQALAAAVAAAEQQRAAQQQQQQQQKQQQQQQAKPSGRPPGRSRPHPRARTASASAAANGAGGSGAAAAAAGGASSYTMLDLYNDYWLPFGKVLTDMEAEGVRVNRAHLSEQEKQAWKDQAAAEAHFKTWAARYVPGAQYMNVNSTVQIRQLLFPDSCDGPVKTFKASNPEYDPNARPRPKRWIDFDLHGLWGCGVEGHLEVAVKTDKGTPAVSGAVLWSLAGKPGAAKKALDELDAAEAAAAAAAAADNGSSSSSSSGGYGSGDGVEQLSGDDGVVIAAADDDGHHDLLDGQEAGDAAQGDDDKEPHVTLVPGAGLDPQQLAALQEEAASKKLGKMYAAMGGGREGLEACLALEKLIEVSAIDKLLSAFIQPLQSDNISTTKQLLLNTSPDSAAGDAAAAAAAVDAAAGTAQPEAAALGNAAVAAADRAMDIYRIHCSLNLNTETGRLSARRPNLQNQPAMEKDRYKVRKAFTAEPGKTLVVADYGQLELRLLAHMADCKSMIRAFELGGDFHSRTALGMYDYIQEAIDQGECLLEWDEHQGEAPAPLLKDKFGGERRKAKILNFSIAYGKTAHGLSKDWGVSLQEAEATVDRWYADRPEVRQWQADTKRYAFSNGWVNTMIGRRRELLPGIRSPDIWVKARAERAAINTPIQGSAADVASAAMLSIVKDEWLRENGWKLLLQVHDEVMLEGPKETAVEARARVVACMENPWDNLIGFKGKPLRVDLAVDANTADTWYEAK